MSLSFKIVFFFFIVSVFTVYIMYNAILLIFPYVRIPRQRRQQLENDIDHLVKLFGKPRDEFNPGIIFKLALVFNVRSRYIIRRLMIDIFNHMDVDGSCVNLRIIRVDASRFEDVGDGVSGLFSVDNGKQSIEVFVKKDYSLWEIAAIMCHECTHYFMYYHMIPESQGGLNENLTDVAAIFLGFGSIMQVGYDEKVRQIETQDNILISRSKLGYISKLDISYIIRKIKKIKKNMK